MKLIAFLISVFAFEQLSKDMKNLIARELEPFSAIKMISLTPKMRKTEIYENLKVPRDFYPFELFQIAAVGKYCVCDENGRLNENINLYQVDEEGRNFLHVAAWNGHTEVVKGLAELGAALNKADNDGTTPISKAAYNGYTKVVKALVEHGADLNKADCVGYTPVYIAAYKGHTEVVKALAEHGADLNKPNNGGRTPISSAAGYGRLEVVKILAQHGADLNKARKYKLTPVYAAADFGHTEVVKFLIESKVKLDEMLLEIAETAEIKQMIQNELEK